MSTVCVKSEASILGHLLDHNNPSSQHAWSYEWNVHLNHYLCPYGNNGARERESLAKVL